MAGSEPRRRRARRAALALAGGLAWAATATAADPQRLLAELRSTVLDPQRAVAVEQLDLSLGPARLQIERGLLVPTSPVGGRTIELVFVGEATLRLEPPDEIEAGQLELFTGRRTLLAAVQEAALVLADAATVAALLDRPAGTPRPDELERAAALHRAWLASAERRTSAVVPAAFKSRLGDRAFGGYFAAWCRGREIGDVLLQLDPEDPESLTLAGFVPLSLHGWERQRLQRHIRVQQRKGRWLGVDPENLGSWDVWLSSAWQPDDGGPLPGNLGFEAEHYEIEATLSGRNLRLEGRARLELRAEDDGRRAVTLELFPDLEVVDVRDDDGRKLFSFRAGREVVVVLPEPSHRGDRFALHVRYTGRPLDWVSRRTFDLLDTAAWYPHCGTVDRATYDVTLHWPRRLDLLAGGRRVDGGRRGGRRWERRVLDRPAIAFSFVIGEFDVERERSRGTELAVAFHRGSGPTATPEVRRELVRVVAESLRFFEDAFGPYPLSELTVITFPRSFSQSYPGFVTLADSVVLSEEALANRGRRWIRDVTVAHEVAHQWWGNQVGWWSYRDQWLSEAMANYSALLFHARVRDDRASFLADMSAGWRDSLARITSSGRSIESLGPIVLGARLNSSRARNAYRTIVYRKGAVVLAMLARALGEERFLDVLRSLVRENGDGVMTTESFLEAVQRGGDVDLGGFARQYVYGTGIPQVYYDYEVEATSPGNWTLRGEARRVRAPEYRHRVVRPAPGSWDVLRSVRYEADTSESALLVPFRVTLGGPGDPPQPGRGTAVREARSGSLLIEGGRLTFELESEREPIGLELDPRDEILARFYAAERHPKRVARYRAGERMLDGDLDGAEARFLDALAAEPGPWDEIDDLPFRSRDADVKLEDARIRLALTRLYADRGRDADATETLDGIDALLREDPFSFRMEREALRARLEVRAGRHAAAWRRLRKMINLADPPRGPVYWRDVIWRQRLISERLAVTEAYALMVVAAFETGNEQELARALAESRERGVDVTEWERERARRRDGTP